MMSDFGSDTDELLKEYIERLNGVFWPLKLLGMGRFDISNERIVRKSLSSIFFSMCILSVILSCGACVIYVLTLAEDFDFLITEEITLLDFLVFHTCVLCNMSFVNRRSVARFINASIDVDVFLGVKNTVFMREITTNIYFSICTFVGFAQIIILLVLLFTYTVPLVVLVTSGILFGLLYTIYYDLSFFLSLYTFLTLRVRYLNVAIMKLANVKLEYLPEQYPFNALFWNKKYDEVINFHDRANLESYNHAFVMLFDQLRHLENCYRFTIFCCLTYLIVGTFVTVQGLIISLKSLNVEIMRQLAVVGWCTLSWMFQIGLSQQTDMFTRQIYQTNLICTYIQLKPTYPDEIYALTSSIMRTIEVRDSRISIYGLFYFDTALLLRITSSIFVYVTMQLQIAFPKNPDVITVDNSTASTM